MRHCARWWRVQSHRTCMTGKQCDFQLLSGEAFGNLTTFRDKMPNSSSSRDWTKVYWGVGIGGGVLVICLLCVGGLECARWSRFKKAVKELSGEPDAKEVSTGLTQRGRGTIHLHVGLAIKLAVHDLGV